MLSRGQLHLELLDECSHVLVRDDGALPFLHAEYGLVNLQREVVLHLHLAAQTPMVFLLLAGEMHGLGRQNLAAAFQHLALALSA